MANWVQACKTSDVGVLNPTRFDFAEHTFAIYRNPENDYFCTEGLCTHEKMHLKYGTVNENIIECSMHKGQFNFETGEAISLPACKNLKTFPVKVENNNVYILVDTE